MAFSNLRLVRRIAVSRQTVQRCRARVTKSEALLQRSNASLGRGIGSIERSAGRLAHGADPTPAARTVPAHVCLDCGQTLTHHDSRVEVSEAGRSRTIDVYFCLRHGFFHVVDGATVARGM